MDYFEKKKILDSIKEDIEELKDFDSVEHYIDANFCQFLRYGEYDDNSIDLSYHYNMLKKIEEDKEFNSKLQYVLSKYIKK